MRKIFLLFSFLLAHFLLQAQLKWINVDSLYQPLPPSVHVYFTNDPVDTGAFRAYYLVADIKDKKLDFTVDTTLNRRLTPSAFYDKNYKPLVVVNTTFFSFESNRSLNAVVKNGKLVAFNQHSIAGRGKDTLTYRHPFASAIGISKKRKADVAWLYTDSSLQIPLAIQCCPSVTKDSVARPTKKEMLKREYPADKSSSYSTLAFEKWKMQTAVGGGPVLLQNGEIRITNNEEMKFGGKAINDKHPRTAMGYTPDGKLIILMVEGRNKVAHGATLTQEAQLFKDLGCVEALNLDGGGSSCLLVNGKETIKVSDATGQRPVPAVFIIREK